MTDAKVLLVVDDGEPNVGLLEPVLRSRGVALHARARSCRVAVELRPAPVLLDLRVLRIAP